MTENKRFTIAIDSNNLKSLWDKQRTEEEPLICLNRFDEISGIDECCDLLNELNDENEQLKQKIKQLQYWNKCLAEKRHQELKGDVE